MIEMNAERLDTVLVAAEFGVRQMHETDSDDRTRFDHVTARTIVDHLEEKNGEIGHVNGDETTALERAELEIIVDVANFGVQKMSERTSALLENDDYGSYEGYIFDATYTSKVLNSIEEEYLGVEREYGVVKEEGE